MAQRKERSILCFVGRTNAGKSSLLNVLSGQEDFAIVDPTPGTTADTVTSVMEIHGVGPCKILDTAGVDEDSALGQKKRRKTFEAMEEADCSIIVIDLLKAAQTQDVSVEKELLRRIEEDGKQALLVFNVNRERMDDEKTVDANRLLVDRLLGSNAPSLLVDASDAGEQAMLVAFIRTFFHRESREIDLLPCLRDTGFVLLIIPMDEETPTLRLLRPQDMAVERILRKYAIPVLFRLNLRKARSSDPGEVREERDRYERLLRLLGESSEGLQLVLTDSQAFDVVAHWTPEALPLTSFSIMMTNYMSFGNLQLFTDGARAVDTLRPGDGVLIVEACNHSRQCDDLGTVQIPRWLEKRVGGKLDIRFSFGRTFPDDLSGIKLIVHCGACMIDRQKYLRRILRASEAGIAFTNYGILLSFLQGPQVLERTVRPFPGQRKSQ